MKKVLFLGVFGVFCLFLVVSAEAGYRGSFCTPSPNRQFGQLNWLHEDGGLFVGHLGSTRGSWTPPPACYRPPQQSYDSQRSYHDRRYDRRYDQHDRRGSNDFVGNIIGGVIGGVVAGVIMNSNNQPAPVYTPPQPVYTPPPPPVYSAPAPISRREACKTNRAYVTGDSVEAIEAVKNALRVRGYAVENSADCEVRVNFTEEGDPVALVSIRWMSSAGLEDATAGAERFKAGDALKRRDAILIAARSAVNKH